MSRAFLGVTLDSSFSAARATEMGLPRPLGARVIKVSENSPAAAADLREGDVILQFNGIAVDNDTHLVNLVKLTEIGKQVTLLVLRDRRTFTVRAVAVDRGPGG